MCVMYTAPGNRLRTGQGTKKKQEICVGVFAPSHFFAAFRQKEFASNLKNMRTCLYGGGILGEREIIVGVTNRGFKHRSEVRRAQFPCNTDREEIISADKRKHLNTVANTLPGRQPTPENGRKWCHVGQKETHALAGGRTPPTAPPGAPPRSRPSPRHAWTAPRGRPAP